MKVLDFCGCVAAMAECLEIAPGQLAIEVVESTGGPSWEEALPGLERARQRIVGANLDPGVDWNRLMALDRHGPLEQAASRAALSTALRDLPFEADSWISASVAHTAGAGAAVAFVAPSDVQGRSVGIDLELADRVVDPRISSRMAHPEDQADGLSLIGRWTAKEAVFKVTGTAAFAGIRLELSFRPPGLWCGMALESSRTAHVAIAEVSPHFLACALGIEVLKPDHLRAIG